MALAPHADAKPLPLVKQVASRMVNHRADDYSLNWGGYFVGGTSNDLTQVSSRLVTPKAALLLPTLNASWVGIGGARSTDLIQAGVAYGYTDGYYAWFETLPAPLTAIRSGCVGDNSCSVAAGDQFDVDIRNTGGDNWHISIVNLGKWSWSLDTTYASTFSSADFIYEAPTTNLLGIVPVLGIPANDKYVPFFNNTYTEGGVQKTLTQAAATTSYVAPLAGINLATPSPIRPNGNFAVCPLNQTCAAP